MLALQQNPAYRRVGSRMYPAIGRHALRPIKAGAHRLVTEAVDPRRAVIPADLRRELEHLSREDVSRLARYMSLGFDGWGVLGDRSTRVG